MELSPSQLADWDRDGWLALRAVIEPSTVAALAGGVDRLVEWSENAGRGLHHFEATDAGTVIARSERFVDDEPTLGSFIRSGLVPDLLAQLFGEPAVLFKEKVNYKHPGGGGFAPHQDATAYRFVDHHISVMVPLDPATVESGCLDFAPGHTRGQLETDGHGRIAADVADQLDWRAVEAAPGDLVVFDSYAPHRSDTNHSSRPRRALYLTYNGASRGDRREEYYRNKEAEFARLGATFDGERVRMSINDDFLGKAVVAGE
jgi:ectoine hydroxylase-related dioxygenase (phytanoyl-CoA dioxygenase family)